MVQKTVIEIAVFFVCHIVVKKNREKKEKEGLKSNVRLKL